MLTNAPKLLMRLARQQSRNRLDVDEIILFHHYERCYRGGSLSIDEIRNLGIIASRCENREESYIARTCEFFSHRRKDEEKRFEQ